MSNRHYSILTAIAIFWFLCAILPGCTGNSSQSTTGTIRAGDLQVYYERQGSGEAIVLLHAGLQDHTMWREQVNALSRQYEVIAIDLPFHGNTTGADTVVLVQDVIRIVMDSLKIQKASMAGLSMGAAAAMDFVIAYPQRVNKAFFISPGINGSEKKFPVDSVSMMWYNQFSDALAKKDTVRAAVEFTKAWAEGIYRSSDSLKQPVSRYVYNTTLATLKRHNMKGWPKLQNDPPAMESLSSIKVPVLIVDGDKDLPYINTASQYLEKNIPGAKHVVIKDVAHMLNMEKPDELNRLMIDFLQGK